MTTLDLNSDLGESFGRWELGDDEAMLALVTSANVACGFHAGDPTTLRRTCVGAAEHGVVVGAQVGYRDLAGFGRRFIDVALSEVSDGLLDAEVRWTPGSLEVGLSGSDGRWVDSATFVLSALALLSIRRSFNTADPPAEDGPPASRMRIRLPAG